MKRVLFFFINIIPELVFVLLVLVALHVKYTSRFEHCREIEERLRIPLWPPYEIVDFRGHWTSSPRGVELHDWNMWNISGHYNERTYVAGTDSEQEALKYLTEIRDFTLGHGVVGGVRRVLPGPDGRKWPDRYFLFAKGRAEVSYFKDREEFLQECRKYGVDGTSLRDFSENWLAFWRRHDASSGLLKELGESFQRGFTWGERAFLLFLVLCYFLAVGGRIRRRRALRNMSP